MLIKEIGFGSDSASVMEMADSKQFKISLNFFESAISMGRHLELCCYNTFRCFVIFVCEQSHMQHWDPHRSPSLVR